MLKSRFNRLLAIFNETFGLGRVVAIGVIVLLVLVIGLTAYWFFHSAPPDTIILTSGPEGSAFQSIAEKYRKVLERNGVTLKILPSQGSRENLALLADPIARVDIGFVQGGMTNGIKCDHLVSLGSIAYEPLMIFYRSPTPIKFLSELVGKRLTIGPAGSGSRPLSINLLGANGHDTNYPGRFMDLDSKEAAKALMEGTVDAVFLMGDSASPQVMRQLLKTPEVQLYDFTQADAYTRRITYLNKIVIPMGAIDFGKNIPDHDINLIGPTAELLARPDLNPALSDLLLETAREVHGRSTLLQRQGEFPAPLEHEFRLSADAARYYKSGKGFFYRSLPFWLASLLNRILVVFVPTVLVVIPGLRMIPSLYRWRIKLRLYRWYRAMLMLERELFKVLPPEQRQDLLAQLDHIEEEVNKMKMPASFADQFYVLRGHINFVRGRLANNTTHAPPH